MSRYSILQVSGVAPARSGDGSSATMATLRAMCRAGHRVTYAFYLPEDAIHEEHAPRLLDECNGNLKLLPLFGLETARDRFARACDDLRVRAALQGLGLLRALRNPATRELVNPIVAMLQGPPAREAGRQLRARIRSGSFDLVQVEYPWMIRLVRELPADLLRVFVAHEVQGIVAGQAEASAPHVRRHVETFERRRMREYDAVWTLSEGDAAFLRTRYGLDRVEATPHAIDCASPAPPEEPGRRRGAARFSFLGGHVHPPNRDAVEWLCGAIVPALAAAFPDMRLDVIGRYPAPFVADHSGPRVRFRGFVENLGHALRGTLFLCPLRIGSGMRVKVLEATMHGAPVIATEVGAGGMGLAAGEHYLRAESPEEFVREARRVLDDERAAAAMVLAAQEAVARTHSPSAVVDRRCELVHELVRERSPCPDRKARASPGQPRSH